MKSNFNTSTYSNLKIFILKASKDSIGKSVNQLLGFTAIFDAEGNKVSMDELIDKIAELSPSPQSIFQYKGGYLLRFEFDKPFDVADKEHENELREGILNFLEENGVVRGILQELEIGKWEEHSVQLDFSGVIE